MSERAASLPDETLRDFMWEAIEEGRKALPGCLPNPHVGCVLVRQGAIIARGFTQIRISRTPSRWRSGRCRGSFSTRRCSSRWSHARFINARLRVRGPPGPLLVGRRLLARGDRSYSSASGFDAATDQSLFENVSGTVQVRGATVAVEGSSRRPGRRASVTRTRWPSRPEVSRSIGAGSSSQRLADWHPWRRLPCGAGIFASYVGDTFQSFGPDDRETIAGQLVLDLAARVFLDAERRHKVQAMRRTRSSIPCTRRRSARRSETWTGATTRTGTWACRGRSRSGTPTGFDGGSDARAPHCPQAPGNCDWAAHRHVVCLGRGHALRAVFQLLPLIRGGRRRRPLRGTGAARCPPTAVRGSTLDAFRVEMLGRATRAPRSVGTAMIGSRVGSVRVGTEDAAWVASFGPLGQVADRAPRLVRVLADDTWTVGSVSPEERPRVGDSSPSTTPRGPKFTCRSSAVARLR